MSAHYGAPRLAHGETTPAYSMGTRTAQPQMPRRKALMMAAATLGAPALAAAVLAVLGASGGGDRPGLGSLSAAHGLRGATAPTAAPASPKPVKDANAIKEPTATKAQAQPETLRQQPDTQHASKAPSREPVEKKQPAPPPHPRIQPQTVPTDPNAPGAPSSTSTGVTSQMSGAGTGTSGSASPGGGHTGA